MNSELRTIDESLSDQSTRAGSGKTALSDLLVTYLEQIGIEYVFGVPGGAIEPLYDALARSARCGGPRAVVARHEAGAAFMADGYSRETGRLGVCCATTGPGTTNLITGVASAYTDRTPMLVLSAQTALPHFGRGALQESSCTAINTVAMFDDCTVYNTLVSHPDQLEGKLIAAVMRAFHVPRGPAHLSIPRDVLAMARPSSAAVTNLLDLLNRPQLVDYTAVEALCRELARARRVAILVGEDCGSDLSLVVRFAEAVGAPLLVTPHGKSWVDPRHPLFRGVFGFAGHDSAREVLADLSLDLILAVGTSMDEFGTSGWDNEALLNSRLVHIDSTAENFTRSPMARLHVYGNIRAVFTELLRRATEALAGGRLYPRSVPPLPEVAGTAGLPRGVSLLEPDKCLAESAPVKPQRLMHRLVELFPAHTRFVADAGNSFVWTTHYLHPRQAGTYRVGMGFGAMAWGIGAAVGTALGRPGVPVVCFTGDGSMLMSGQELTVAVAEQLPVVFVVLNDRALGMVRHGQRLAGAEQTAFELPPVDFAAVARAMGAQGITIRSSEELGALDIAAICSHPGPTVLDVMIDPEEVPPMRMRVRTLAALGFV